MALYGYLPVQGVPLQADSIKTSQQRECRFAFHACQAPRAPVISLLLGGAAALEPADHQRDEEENTRQDVSLSVCLLVLVRGNRRGRTSLQEFDAGLHKVSSGYNSRWRVCWHIPS